MSDRARAERSWGLGRLLCLLLFAYAIAVALGAFAPPRAAAAEDPAPRSQDAASGKLFVRTLPGGELIAAPLLSTEVKIAVSGLVARAQVRQSFRNAGTDWVEGVYVFPLPENSAVDRLRLRIGERTVEGRIAEREAAQREYTAARNEGRRVGLVEQERPNMFTTSIANIGPSETIVVEIEYQDTPRFDHGAFELRFPLVVGPRYIPGNPLVASTRGWAGVTDLVADADRITPPVRDPAEGPGNPVTIEVTLDAGMALAEVRSATHRIVVTPAEQNRMHVRLADETVPADRDFELTWAPAVGTAPRAGLFVEHRDGESHLLLMIVPPDRPAPEVRTLPREAIFIIDTSGSMAGTSIVQAKAALRLALDRLSPRDRFNIIEFNSTASALFGSAQLADAEALRKARNFVDGLRANGGTEMRAALDLALDGRRDPGRIRQIVFLTDGLVGNEAALFPKIVEGLGDSRLFTVGIGSAPNQWFMTRGARAGRGTFTNISRIEEVERRMSALFEKLEKPVLTDLAARWPAGVTVEGYPDPLPDLYAGEPVVIAAKPPPGGLPVGTVVTLTGRFGSEAWSESLSLDHHAEAPGVAALWARRKIERLDETLSEGEDRIAVRAASLTVALGYGLISRYTSLIAVDTTVSRPPEQRLQTAPVPPNLPAGMQAQAVFGPSERRAQAQPQPPAPTAASAADIRNPTDAAPVQLPATATSAELQMLAGAIVMMLALFGFLWMQRRA